MSTRQRLAQFTEKVKQAGLAGEEMTAELMKIAQANDLTAEEISRIAEMANREVQLGLYKTAADKRFKFKLADPGPVKEAARKHASQRPVTSAGVFDKVATALDDIGGDPFASPYREQENLSLFKHEPNPEAWEKMAAEKRSYEDRTMIFELDKSRLETEAVYREGEQWRMKIAEVAVSHEKQLIQAAMDMVYNNVTIPSIYEALVAAVSGSTVPEEETEAADTIMRMVLDGLKARGVENYRMGFRDHYDPEGMAKMTTDQLLARCKQLSAYSQERDENTFSMRDTKTAEVYSEAHVGRGPASVESVDGGINALDLLHERPSIMQHQVPQMYVDDAQNTPGGKPRVINASNEFVVAVKNLVGEQFRLRQVHGAQEYLGLKLKQLEEAIRKLTNIRQLEDERLQKALPKAEPQGVG